MLACRLPEMFSLQNVSDETETKEEKDFWKRKYITFSLRSFVLWLDTARIFTS